MNELLVKVAFGLLRIAAAPLVEWLNRRDVLTSDESAQLLMLIAALLVSVGFEVRRHVIAMRERNTAAAKASVSTPAEIQADVRAGKSAPALAPSNLIPVIRERGPV